MAEDIEVELFLEAIWRRYGYDFRNYARSSLRRRLSQLLSKWSFTSLSHLQYRVLRDQALFEQILNDITVSTTEMFRDADFYKVLRREVLPVLSTYPTLNIWHAGCSTGEEVYSLAILLSEEGIYGRTTLYATDINPAALAVAAKGEYPLSRIREMTAAYQKAGGTQPFSSYYSAGETKANIADELKKNIVFSTHNLATDEAFIEAQLVICRNVLIYFDRSLQDRAVQLMTRSLCHKGFLCLGSKESVRFLDAKVGLEDFAPNQKIYRKNANSSFVSSPKSNTSCKSSR